MTIKKHALIITVLILIIALIPGCTGQETGQESPGQRSPQQEETQKISIICTIFPQYDWVRQIIGDENIDRFDVTFLISSGADLHNFNPSVQDMTRIMTSDAFIYVGGHSDSWVDDVMRRANPDIAKLNLMDTLIEAMGEHDLLEGFCDVDCDEEHDHSHEETHADEHIWLSLRRAKILCSAIADLISELDPEHAQTYKENAETYIARLTALDAEFHIAVESANFKTLVFADRFPFRYLMDDYGLNHYAAFQGCSAESEASFVTIISLANRLNQLGLNAVMVTETSDQSIARTVINSTDAGNHKILVLHAAHSVTVSQAETGVTYLSIMRNNLETLKEAME